MTPIAEEALRRERGRGVLRECRMGLIISLIILGAIVMAQSLEFYLHHDVVFVEAER